MSVPSGLPRSKSTLSAAAPLFEPKLTVFDRFRGLARSFYHDDKLPHSIKQILIAHAGICLSEPEAFWRLAHWSKEKCAPYQQEIEESFLLDFDKAMHAALSEID